MIANFQIFVLVSYPGELFSKNGPFVGVNYAATKISCSIIVIAIETEILPGCRKS